MRAAINLLIKGASHNRTFHYFLPAIPRRLESTTGRLLFRNTRSAFRMRSTLFWVVLVASLTLWDDVQGECYALSIYIELNDSGLLILSPCDPRFGVLGAKWKQQADFCKITCNLTIEHLINLSAWYLNSSPPGSEEELKFLACIYFHQVTPTSSHEMQPWSRERSSHRHLFLPRLFSFWEGNILFLSGIPVHSNEKQVIEKESGKTSAFGSMMYGHELSGGLRDDLSSWIRQDTHHKPDVFLLHE